LGDEFNSSGSSDCGSCGGSGVDIGDCPTHHDRPKRNWDPEAGDLLEDRRL
jgi:hypothetical protein